MTHLGKNALLAWIEGARDPAMSGHLERCQRCRDEAASLERVLRGVADVEIPEPSPLFWDHLSRRVRERIDAGETPYRPWRERVGEWGWRRALIALGPAAAVVLAAVVAWPGLGRFVASRSLPATVEMPALTSSLATDEWEAVVELARTYEEEETSERVSDVLPDVLLAPGSADRAAAELTADEARELARLLELELGRS